MNENRDDETGQYASTEPLFGREGLEAAAGYVPMPEEKPDDGELTIEEAKAKLDEMAPEEPEPRALTADMPDNMTMTIDQAVKALTDANAADEAQIDDQTAEQIRKEVDALRAEDQPAEQPVQEAKAEEAKPEPATPEAEVEKFLANPHVKQAVEKFNAAAQEHVAQAVNQALDFNRAAFAERFPEIANLPVEQWEGALVAMAQREPERFRSAFNSLSRINQLQISQQQQQQQVEQKRQAELAAYAKMESDRFEEMIKDTPKAQRAEIENHIVEAIKEYGGDVEAFARLMQRSEFSNAAVQRLLWDVGKYRAMMKAPKPQPSRQPPPRVQRPGVAGAAKAIHETSSLAALSNRLAQTGHIDDAFALYQARQRARG